MKIIPTNQIPTAVRDLLELTLQQREAALKAWVSYATQERPEGSTDDEERWMPSKAEHHDCCDEMRVPSRAWPWTIYQHCFTLDHKANKFVAKKEHILAIKRWLAAQDIDITDCSMALVEPNLRNIESEFLREAADEAANDAVSLKRQRL